MIIWGTKKVYRHLGYVADFCPICAGVRPFSLERVGMAGHVYYISAGEGDLVGYQLNCLDCNILMNGDPQRYAAFAPQPESTLKLIDKTFPNIAQFQQARLSLEHQIRTALPSVPADTRRSLIIEPFLLLSPKVVKRFSETHFEMGRTFMRREIIPVLAGTLARLRPSEEELQAVLAKLMQMRDPIGSRVKLADLMAALTLRYAEAPAPESTVFGTQEFNTAQAGSGKPMRRAGARAAGSLMPYERAAKTFKVLAWITAIGTVILALAELNSSKPIGQELIVVSAALTALTAAMFYASSAIMQHAKHGRILGICLSVLLLPWLPIGTILGASILWNLTKGWGADTPAGHYAA